MYTDLTFPVRNNNMLIVNPSCKKRKPESKSPAPIKRKRQKITHATIQAFGVATCHRPIPINPKPFRYSSTKIYTSLSKYRLTLSSAPLPKNPSNTLRMNVIIANQTIQSLLDNEYNEIFSERNKKWDAFIKRISQEISLYGIPSNLQLIEFLNSPLEIGVCARTFIPSGTLLGLYTGRYLVEPFDQEWDGSNTTYDFQIADQIKVTQSQKMILREAGLLQAADINKVNRVRITIDSSEESCFTRFINHSQKHYNAVASLERISGRYVVAIISSKDIPIRHQVLFNYTDSYWEYSSVQPLEVKPDGHLFLKEFSAITNTYITTKTQTTIPAVERGIPHTLNKCLDRATPIRDAKAPIIADKKSMVLRL